MKKILIALLSFLTLFLIGSKIKADANSEWTLEADGYYYYNNDVLFDEEIHYLVSNGNPIFIKGVENEDWGIYDYKIAIKARLIERTETAKVQYLAVNRHTEEYTDIFYDIHGLSGLSLSYASLDETSTAPIEIRYNSTLYNADSPGDLSLPGYPDYELVQTTAEEFDFVGWSYQYGFQIKHNYLIADINDPNFIKHNLKIFYHDANFKRGPRQGIEYDLEKVIMDVEKIGQETTYWKVVTDESDVINVQSFNDLPLTDGNFENGLSGIGRVFATEIDDSHFDLQVNYNNQIYKISTNSLPEHLVLSKKVHYFTEKGQRYFVGFYETEDGYSAEDTLADDIIENSWIIWNASTGEYTRSETNTIHAKLTSESKNIQYTNQLYADIVIPHEIDDLLSIAVAYQFRHVYLIGDKGAWQTVSEQILMKDEKSDYELPWYNSLFGFYNWAINSNRTTRELFGIKQIELIDTDVQYKNDYVNWMNERNVENNIDKTYTVNDIFIPNSKTYSLYLGTFNKFGSVNLDTQNFAVLKYRYEYKGVEYSNPFPKTEAPSDKENKSPADPVISWFKTIFNKAWGFIVKYVWIAIPIIGLITSPIIIKSFAAIFGRKVYKKRLLIVLGWIGLLMVIWFSLV